MKLKRVLRLHDQSKSPNGLKNVLGDSFLAKKNPMFLRVRELARANGFRYVEAWESYRRASLFELPTILKKKTIPYNDSVPTLHRLARDHQVDDEMEDVPVETKSYHFHESAHAVADTYFKKCRPKSKSEKILIALLSESYANAVESMAVTFVNDEIHQFFLAQNSYIYAEPTRARRRKEAMEAWGSEGLLRVLWIAYLYSNFLIEDLPAAELQGAMGFALGTETVPKKDLRLAVSFFRDAQELSIDFRMKTARIYMRMLGLKGDVQKNLAFDFARLFQSSTPMLEAFTRLALNSVSSVDEIEAR